MKSTLCPVCAHPTSDKRVDTVVHCIELQRDAKALAARNAEARHQDQVRLLAAGIA